MAPVWVSTKANPADAPSRDVPLPVRGPRPSWSTFFWKRAVSVGLACDNQRQASSHHRLRGQGFKAREYHAGSGGLALSLEALGVESRVYEAYPGGVYDATFDLELDDVINPEIDDIESGAVDFFHSGITCASWSVLSSLNQGTRSIENPWVPTHFPERNEVTFNLSNSSK